MSYFTEAPLWEIAAAFIGYFAFRAALFQGVGYALRFTPYFTKRRIFKIDTAPGQERAEILPNMIYFVSEGLVCACVFHFGLIAKSAGSVLASFAICYVWWDLSYYVLHRALHTKRLFFIHRHHHVARINSALSGSSFSTAEGLLTLLVGWGPLIVLSHWLPLSYLGMFLYNEHLCFMRTTGHFNSEYMPPFSVRFKIFSWHQTVTFHAMHHARYAGHYGLMTTIPDRLFGTAFADYEDLHDRAFKGEGANSLHAPQKLIKISA